MTDLGIWRPIAGWEGFYEASSNGQVRSVPRTFVNKRGSVCTFPGKSIKPRRRKDGYWAVKLSDRAKNRNQPVALHRAVALAFHPNPLSLCSVNHIDGDKGNNKALNLEWSSRGDNSKHAWRTGLMTPPPKGQRHHNAKLTDETAAFVRTADLRSYGSQRKLARSLGVSTSTVQLIRAGKRYAGVGHDG